MPAEKNSPKYKWDFGSAKVAKNVSSIEVNVGLDQSASLIATVTLSQQDANSLSPRDLPQEASFQWGEREWFKGHLFDASHTDRNHLALTFHDPLFPAHKAHENLYFKQQTLQESLDKITGILGLSARYVGSFGETIPSMNLTGDSLFDHLANLSETFGFYFFSKASSDQIYFLKVGSYVKDLETDSKLAISGVNHSQAPSEYLSQVNFKYFDHGSLESKEKRMGASDLYSPLGSFRDHGGFREKTTWKQAQGSLDTSVNQSSHFESGDEVTRNQLSKRLMGQETLMFSTNEPLGLPGDRLKVKGPQFSNGHEGAYLVRSCRVSAEGSAPRLEIEAIRP